ncbi:ubiquitin-conjugating enzyme E2 Q2 [Naviculisporaceae sp. PSN 640]
MSLKRFNTDLSNASQKVAVGAIAGVDGLESGDSEGEVVIKYRHGTHLSSIRALATAVHDYPEGNSYLLFTDDENQAVTETLARVQHFLFGMRVYEVVTEVSRNLQTAFREDKEGEEEGEEDDADDEDCFGLESGSEDEYDLDDDAFGLAPKPTSQQRISPHTAEKQLLARCRLRRDLRLVKQAGYKVGILNDLRHSGSEGIVSISIRAQKLALSDEAKEAWDVEDDDYIVLLIRFGFYTPIEHVMEQASTPISIQFRIGKCSRYKPSFPSALAAFDLTPLGEKAKPQNPSNEPSEGAEPDDNFHKLFISNSLDQFLDECFIPLLRLRRSRKCSWDEANLILESRAINQTADSELMHGGSGGSGDALPADCPEDPYHRPIPGDHLSQTAPEHGHSLPLIAMEFAMDYFVRCTEYCLRCHRKVDKSFGALRPYVCDKPLCLFQYMALGLGPNVEHEILTEPYVVDLLVNLCYSALDPIQGGRWTNPMNARKVSALPIRELPVGLRMNIPDLMGSSRAPLKAHLSQRDDQHVLVLDTMDDRDLRPEKWIAFRRPGQNKTKHGVIVEVDRIKRSLHVKVASESGEWSPDNYDVVISDEGDAGRPPTGDGVLVHAFLYDTDLDSLPHLQKGAMVRHVLDTMPPILDIAAFLASSSRASLRSMNTMSAAAASLLQWIVCSNRSCIYQVDSCEEISRTTQRLTDATKPVPFQPTTRRKNRAHERIPGMAGWIQFRFAQGSPDKEVRFKRALQEVAARHDIQRHPTIFAWHGSRLSNWHSIVRTGLDFNDVRNGRAYGNGVYFSNQYDTSKVYSGPGTVTWGKSALGFSTCVSLNEIINCPDEFVQTRPHYVVSQLDWHQCRYLFVRASSQDVDTSAFDTDTNNQQFHAQPSGLAITGPFNRELKIPLAAIPFRAVGPTLETQLVATKRTTVRREEEESDEEDLEDVQFLFSDDDQERQEPKGPLSKKTTAHGRSITPASTDTLPLTDFRPGTLDLSTLPTMGKPKSASDFATKAIVRELGKLQALQSKTPLHELGWYMDFEKMENMFQWIVEFHSFDLSLPLAQDMKQLGVTSIVFEIRFGANYPMSPPFVRVIRPHFLPFTQGGGGHVTAGGAMCMELLTNSGWSPANSMESVFLQVRMALQSLEPKPARLSRAVGNGVPGPIGDYRVGEAIEAYTRAARLHRWNVPTDLYETANGL